MIARMRVMQAASCIQHSRSVYQGVDRQLYLEECYIKKEAVLSSLSCSLAKLPRHPLPIVHRLSLAAISIHFSAPARLAGPGDPLQEGGTPHE